MAQISNSSLSNSEAPQTAFKLDSENLIVSLRLDLYYALGRAGLGQAGLAGLIGAEPSQPELAAWTISRISLSFLGNSKDLVLFLRMPFGFLFLLKLNADMPPGPSLESLCFTTDGFDVLPRASLGSSRACWGKLQE